MQYTYKQPNDLEVIFDENTDFSTYKVDELSLIYSQMTGKPTTFRQRAVGEKMIKALLSTPAELKPEDSPGDTPVPPIPGAATRGKKSTIKAPRKDSIPKDAKIILVVEPNPKRADTNAYEMYKLYKVGMTPIDLAGAGVSTADLKYNLAHEYIKFDKLAPTAEDIAATAVLEAHERKLALEAEAKQTKAAATGQGESATAK